MTTPDATMAASRGAYSEDRRPSRSLVLLAWGVSVAALALDVVSVILQVLTRSTPVPGLFGFRGSTALPAVVFALVGLLLSVRRPGNPIGWIFLATAVISGLQRAALEYAVYDIFAGRADLVGAEIAAWVAGWTWVPLVGLVGIFVILLFPDGRLVSPRWRFVAWLGAVAIAVTSFGFATLAGPLDSAGGIINPFGIDAPWWEGLLYGSFLFLYVGSMVAATISFVVRFRRARGVERAQIKWVAYAAAMMAVALGVGSIFFATAPRDSVVFRVFANLVILFLSAIPVAVAVGILRYRLYEIDRLINRTLVYAALTAVLTVLYLALAVLLGTVAPLADSDLAIAGSTLVVATLFRPARARIQGFIDRRFYRSRYDAAKTVAGFSARLRDQVELEAVTADLLGVVRETVHPVHASLWLREARGTQR